MNKPRIVIILVTMLLLSTAIASACSTWKPSPLPLPIVPTIPIVESTTTTTTSNVFFYGMTFSKSDCERISILSNQLDNETLRPRALYLMDIIISDYNVKSVYNFTQKYCLKLNLTFNSLENLD